MNVVTIGGGTGQFGILRALTIVQKKVRTKSGELSITAIPTTMDSGGASGQLRLNHQIIAPGDIGQCILALCEDPVRDAWLFDGARHFKAGNVFTTFRNYVVSQALLYHGNKGSAAMAAIKATFNLRGTIAPITFSRGVHVKAVLKDGRELHSEDEIYHADIMAGGGIERLWLDPRPVLNPDAGSAIAKADAIIVCPGTLACSIMPNFRVPGAVEGLQKSGAKKRIYVANLMNERRRVPIDWTVRDYLQYLEDDLGPGFFNTVVCNSAPISKAQAKTYAEESVALPGVTDLREEHRTLIALPLITEKMIEMQGGDVLADLRSTVRHDAMLTARALEIALEIGEVV